MSEKNDKKDGLTNNKITLTLRLKLLLILIAGVFFSGFCLYTFVFIDVRQQLILSANQTSQAVENEINAMTLAHLQEEERTLYRVTAHIVDSQKKVLSDIPFMLYQDDETKIKEAISVKGQEFKKQYLKNISLLAKIKADEQTKLMSTQISKIQNHYTELNRTNIHELYTQLLIASLWTTLIFIIASSLFVNRIVLHPIHTLMEGTRKIAKGELSHRIIVAAHDEFGRLALSFNNMANRLGQLIETEKALSAQAALADLEKERAVERERALEKEKAYQKLKEIQKKLTESEVKFRNITETAKDAILMLDNKNIIVYWNPEASRVFGYSAVEALGQNIHDFLQFKNDSYPNSFDFNKFSKGDDGSMASRIVEIQTVSKKGLELPVEMSVSTFNLNDRQYSTAIIRDIRVRKQVEKKLKELNTIISRSPLVAFTWKNAEGWPMEYVSENVTGLLGYSWKELVSGTISYSDCIHPDDIERVEQEVESYSQVDQPQNYFVHKPYRIVTRNGDVRWVMDWTVIVRNKAGEISHYQGIIYEITAQKLAEDTLQETEERLRVLINSTPDIICFRDGKGRWMEANDADLEMFSLIDVDYRGKTCSELADYADPIYRDTLLTCEKSDKIAWDLKGVLRREGVVPKPDGTKRVYDVIKVPVFGSDGSRKGLVMLGRDITEQKQAEEERLKLETQLYRSQKMEAIGTLAGGIAHDFNNILSAIIGYSEFVQDEVPEESQVGKDIARVIESGKRGADLVSQILTFSRKKGDEKQPIQPHLIVKEALQMLKATLPSSIDIVEDIDPDSGVIFANPTNIHQVTVNLCTNAVHAMTDGKKVLSVGLKQRIVSAEKLSGEPYSSTGSFVVLSVCDTGCGMSQETIDRIFDPYFSTKEVGKGTGLGLAVTHGIVKDTMGFIEVNSSPGEGSSFDVFFPVMQDCTSMVNESAPTETIQKGNEHILVVDDEPFLVRITARQLKDLGYTVTTTTSSKEALEMFYTDSKQFDLLITDQTMPELTGTELAAAVKEIRPDLPIILSSGHCDLLSQEKAIQLGVEKCVPKPILGRELVNTVRSLLDVASQDVGKDVQKPGNC